ncbi:hypothetical protein RB195_017663 [Necator americanus]|uniref:Uncharacterized protein n=1 Tax=Necator americanus TaxID=51031 RepID=A0ABR1C988_NECAM
MLTLDRRRPAWTADWSITKANGSNVSFGSKEPFEIWREFPRYRQTFTHISNGSSECDIRTIRPRDRPVSGPC